MPPPPRHGVQVAHAGGAGRAAWGHSKWQEPGAEHAGHRCRGQHQHPKDACLRGHTAAPPRAVARSAWLLCDLLVSTCGCGFEMGLQVGVTTLCVGPPFPGEELAHGGGPQPWAGPWGSSCSKPWGGCRRAGPAATALLPAPAHPHPSPGSKLGGKWRLRYAGTYNKVALQALDELMDGAAKSGLRVTLILAQNWRTSVWTAACRPCSPPAAALSACILHSLLCDHACSPPPHTHCPALHRAAPRRRDCP